MLRQPNPWCIKYKNLYLTSSVVLDVWTNHLKLTTLPNMKVLRFHWIPCQLYSYCYLLSTAITASITGSMGSLKAFLLHRVIWEEANEQLVATRCDRWGLLGATETTQTWSFSISPIVKLNVVISTFQVGLHVDLIEGLQKIRWVHIWKFVWSNFLESDCLESGVLFLENFFWIVI